MASKKGLKKGNRVTVLPGVSNCKDDGSLYHDPDDGVSRAHLVRKRGEVIQVGDDGPIACPNPDMVLVDDQYKDGVPQGACTMREWLLPEEVELG